MLKKVENLAKKIANSENGNYVKIDDMYITYNNHRILYMREDAGLNISEHSYYVEKTLMGALKAVLGDYHISYLPSLKDVKEGIKEASGGKRTRVIYTPTDQQFHLNARYMAETMDALSTDVCYYMDGNHPIAFFGNGDFNSTLVEVILPIGTYHKKMPEFVAG